VVNSQVCASASGRIVTSSPHTVKRSRNPSNHGALLVLVVGDGHVPPFRGVLRRVVHHVGERVPDLAWRAPRVGRSGRWSIRDGLTAPLLQPTVARCRACEPG
jgi:hypothetical protein